MSTRYSVKRVPITGDLITPQTIVYSTLTDIDGNSLPNTFQSTPLVGIVGKYQDRSANIVDNSITTSQFQIRMSELEGELDVTTGYYNLLIEGDV